MYLNRNLSYYYTLHFFTVPFDQYIASWLNKSNFFQKGENNLTDPKLNRGVCLKLIISTYTYSVCSSHKAKV